MVIIKYEMNRVITKCFQITEKIAKISVLVSLVQDLGNGAVEYYCKNLATLHQTSNHGSQEWVGKISLPG